MTSESNIQEFRTGHLEPRSTNNKFTNMLLQEPRRLYNLLKMTDVDSETGRNIKYWLDSTNEYSTWYSTGPQILFYLCGKGKGTHMPAIDENDQFCGTDIISNIGITESIGISIFKMMLKFQPDLSVCNYYGENLYECINKSEDTLTKRTDNENFINFVNDCLFLDYLGVDISNNIELILKKVEEPMLFAEANGDNWRELYDWFQSPDLMDLMREQHPDLIGCDVKFGEFLMSREEDNNDIQSIYILDEDLMGEIIYPEVEEGSDCER